MQNMFVAALPDLGSGAGTPTVDSFVLWLQDTSRDARELIDALVAVKKQAAGAKGASDEAFERAKKDLLHTYAKDGAEISERIRRIMEWRSNNPRDARQFGNLPAGLQNAWESVQHAWPPDGEWTRGNAAGTVDTILPELRDIVWTQVYITGPRTINDHLDAMHHGDTLKLKSVLGDEVIDDTMLTEIGKACRQSPRLFHGEWVDDTTLLKIDRDFKTRALNIGLVLGVTVLPLLVVIVLDILERRTDFPKGVLGAFMNKDSYLWLAGYMALALAGSVTHLIVKFIKATNLHAISASNILDWLSIRSGKLAAGVFTVWAVLGMLAFLSATGTEELQLTALTAYFAGYAADSLFGNLFGRFETTVDSLTAAVLESPQSAPAGG